MLCESTYANVIFQEGPVPALRGARVMFTSLNEEGGAAETVVFADGWLDEETGEYLGRPADVANLPDGSLLVSDDFAGAVYRIWYEG